MTNPKIGDMIAPIGGVYQTLSMPTTKEVVAYAASVGAWVNRTLRKLIRTGVDRSTPGNVCNAISVKHAPSPVPIGIISTSPPCGLSRRLQVAKKWKSTPPGLGRNTPKLDAVVDGNLSDDLDHLSIFRKLINHKLSNGSSDEI